MSNQARVRIEYEVEDDTVCYETDLRSIQSRYSVRVLHTYSALTLHSPYTHYLRNLLCQSTE